MVRSITWILVFFVLMVIIQFLRYVRRKRIELEDAFQERFVGQQILYMDKYARIIAQQLGAPVFADTLDFLGNWLFDCSCFFD